MTGSKNQFTPNKACSKGEGCPFLKHDIIRVELSCM